MPKKWSEVAQSQQYQALPPQAQEDARSQYFDQVVAPQIGDPSQVQQAKQQFDQQTANTTTVTPGQDPESLTSAFYAAKAAGDENGATQAFRGIRAQGASLRNPNADELAALNVKNRPERTPLEDAARSAIFVGRNTAQGLASIPGLVIDPLMAGGNKLLEAAGSDARFPSTAQSVDTALDSLRIPFIAPNGVPEIPAENAGDRLAGAITRGAAGAAGGAGIAGTVSRLAGASAAPAARSTVASVANTLAARPAAQVAAGATGSGVAEGIKEAGYGPEWQLLGGLAGGLAPAGLEASGAALTGGAKRLFGAADDATAALGQKATDAGIPLSASQVSTSKVAKALDSVTGQVPFSGKVPFQDVQQQAFNRAVGKTIGIDAPTITNEAFAKARQAISDKFESLTGNNDLALTPVITGKLRAVADSAKGYADDGTIRAVNTLLDRVAEQSQNGILPGKVYQSIDSQLGKLSANGGEKASYLSDLREVLRDGMDASIRPEDQAAWTQARQQWRDMKTIEPLVAKEGATSGNISPGALMARVTSNNAGKITMAQGRRGDLGDLASIGQRFLKETVPDSGTAQRLAIINSLKTGGALLTGAGGVVAPMTTAAMLAGVGGISRATQAALQNPRLVNALLGNPATRGQLLQALGTSATPGVVGLDQANKQLQGR
jgi:hypothetical protein